MARTATLLQIRNRAYQRGGFESETSRHPAAEVTSHINESYADLRDQLARARGTTFDEATTDYTLVVGTSTYALPANFYSLLAVQLNTGASKHPLERYQRLERPALSDTNAGWLGYPYYYALQGANVEVMPTPSVTGMTLTIRYVPTPTTLTNDADTLDGVDGWEEWVVVDVARKMATKERDFELVSALQSDLNRLSERIRALGGARDRAGPGHVVDVRGQRSRRWLR